MPHFAAEVSSLLCDGHKSVGDEGHKLDVIGGLATRFEFAGKKASKVHFAGLKRAVNEAMQANAEALKMLRWLQQAPRSLGAQPSARRFLTAAAAPVGRLQPGKELCARALRAGARRPGAARVGRHPCPPRPGPLLARPDPVPAAARAARAAPAPAPIYHTQPERPALAAADAAAAARSTST